MNEKTKRCYSKLGWAQYRLKNAPTSAELLFKGFLEELTIPFRFQKGMITSKKKEFVRIVDFYIPRIKMIFEIDGEYHNNTYQQIKDSKREQEIKRKKGGVLFMRFTNQQVLTDPERVKQIVKEAYNDRIIDFYYIQNRRLGERAKSKYKII